MGDIGPGEALRFDSARLDGVKACMSSGASSSSSDSRLIICVPPTSFGNLDVSFAVDRVAFDGVVFDNLVLEGVTFEKVIYDRIIAASFSTLV